MFVKFYVQPYQKLMKLQNQVKAIGVTLLVVIVSVTTINVYGVSTYEDIDLGVKLEYPASWQEGMKVGNKESCSGSTVLCGIDFTPIGTTWYPDFVSFTILKDAGKGRCECNNLTDFLRFTHEELLENSAGIKFVNDNQTTIGKDNNSAWLIQYDKSFDSENVNHDALLIKWFTQINNSFYEFTFQADAGEDFIQYYPDVKSMLDSVEFVSTPAPDDKVPSFMLGANNSQVDETDYKDQSEETVKIQGMNSFIQHNSIVNDIFTVVGEVHNIGDTSLTFVRPAITLYDSSNDVIGTDTTFTEPSSIAPGGSASFKFTIFGNSILGGVNAVGTYRVLVSGR